MFVDLMSPWMIGIDAAECKYESTPAVSVAIFKTYVLRNGGGGSCVLLVDMVRKGTIGDKFINKQWHFCL